MRFLWFSQKSNSIICTFLLEYKSTNGFVTFWKDLMHGKKLVLQLWCKNLQTNQNADFSILQYEVNFLFGATIHRKNKFITSFQVGVVRHAQIYPKLSQIVRQFHLKNELSNKMVFLTFDQGFIEVKYLFSHFKWVWSDMLKLIENNRLTISQNEFRYEFDFLHQLKHT